MLNKLKMKKKKIKKRKTFKRKIIFLQNQQIIMVKILYKKWELNATGQELMKRRYILKKFYNQLHLQI